MEVVEKLSLLFFSASMFVNGCLFIPQIVKLFQKKQAKELSLSMFLGFNIIQLSVMLHGYFQQDWVLMVGIGYSFVTCGLVSFLIIWYRHISGEGRN